MPVSDEGRDGPRSRLEAQINLILHGIPEVEDGLEGAKAWPPDWASLDDVDYLYRDRNLLVRDADVDRVRAIVPSVPVENENNLRGLTRLAFTDEETRNIEDVCTAIDRALGEGVATPDHIFYICIHGTCPATEPEEIPSGAPPDPDVSREPCTGEGVLVAVLDSGLLAGSATQHYWLAGVTGQVENPIAGSPPRILPYAGHGTFVAGVLRTMAPKADVQVSRTFRKFGAHFESDLVKDVADAVKEGARPVHPFLSVDARIHQRQRNILQCTGSW